MKIINQELTENYAIYNGDNMEVLPSLKPESIDFSVYSPAFPELYAYSNDPRDMSNCTSYEEGMNQFRFIVNEMARITKPGRHSAVHCMDLKKGSQFQRDFPGDIVKLHEEAGFHFFCRVTIWKDPWLIARRTRMRSLMHKMIVNDSSKCRVAGADYVLIFTKPGVNENPITHPEGLSTYYGEEAIPADLVAGYSNFKGDQRKNLLSHWIWRRYASPVWMDIRSGRLLPYKEARENTEEKHVCPLQMDVVDRCLTLWSNPGDVVLTPFLGVGTEAYCALRRGRRAIGIELKETYFRQASKHMKTAMDKTAPDQFEMEFDDDSKETLAEEVLETPDAD